jgi:hypothetical protein
MHVLSQSLAPGHMSLMGGWQVLSTSPGLHTQDVFWQVPQVQEPVHGLCPLQSVLGRVQGWDVY